MPRRMAVGASWSSTASHECRRAAPWPRRWNFAPRSLRVLPLAACSSGCTRAEPRGNDIMQCWGLFCLSVACALARAAGARRANVRDRKRHHKTLPFAFRWFVSRLLRDGSFAVFRRDRERDATDVVCSATTSFEEPSWLFAQGRAFGGHVASLSTWPPPAGQRRPRVSFLALKIHHAGTPPPDYEDRTAARARSDGRMIGAGLRHEPPHKV